MTVTDAAPIILGNAPSTGSTLLRVLLGRHPAIYCGGELAVLDKPALLDEAADHYRERIMEWLSKGFPLEFVGASCRLFDQLDEYPWDRTGVTKLCERTSGVADLLMQFYAPALAQKGAYRWLEKTPCNVYSFERITTLFPRAKLVHIVRDARHSIPSYCRREPSVFKAVSRWYYATLTGIQYRGRPDYHEVRYEDLVSDPHATLERLCAFLGEAYDPRMVVREATGAYGRGPGGWRYDPAGSISGSGEEATSDLTDGRGMTTVQRAVFEHTRLSSHGASALPAWGACRYLTSPLALQKYLGYGTEILEAVDGSADGAEAWTRDALLAHWADFLVHRARAWRTYRRRLECHTKLCGRFG